MRQNQIKDTKPSPQSTHCPKVTTHTHTLSPAQSSHSKGYFMLTIDNTLILH